MNVINVCNSFKHNFQYTLEFGKLQSLTFHFIKILIAEVVTSVKMNN